MLSMDFSYLKEKEVSQSYFNLRAKRILKVAVNFLTEYIRKLKMSQLLSLSGHCLLVIRHLQNYTLVTIRISEMNIID
jgi:hypothetical protein